MFDLLPGSQLIDFETILNKLAGFGDVFSSIELISSKHPHFDVCLLDIINDIRDVLLQPIFESSSSYQSQVVLKI